MNKEIAWAFGINLLRYHPTIYHPANSFQVQYNAKPLSKQKVQCKTIVRNQKKKLLTCYY